MLSYFKLELIKLISFYDNMYQMYVKFTYVNMHSIQSYARIYAVIYTKVTIPYDSKLYDLMITKL